MPSLEFKGKQYIYAHHLSVPFRPLEPHWKKSVVVQSNEQPENEVKSVGQHPLDTSRIQDDNLVIHGDNMSALKALLPRYAGKVQCIYIDPPYNTGNESWIYNDNVNSPLMKDWIKRNSPVDGEDLERHDKWLCMMWPRLHLLRELLSNNGMIFISIDDNEQHHLRMLMDEIFGEENFLATIVWQHRTGRSNNAKLFSNQREFVITYRKTEAVHWIRVPMDEGKYEDYKNPDNDPRGVWTSSTYENPAKKEERPNLVYPILNPFTGKNVNHPIKAWKYEVDTHKRHVDENRLYWGEDGKYKYPRKKNFLSESQGLVPIDLILAVNDNNTQSGTKDLKEILGESVPFNNPKPRGLIQKCIEIVEGSKGGSKTSHQDTLVLDSFAGSGTTAHAVLELNQRDGGNRKFIVVECEDYADNITAERIRRVIKGIPDSKRKSLREGLGGSFTFCTLGKPLDQESILKGENLPEYKELASYLLYTATGQVNVEVSLNTEMEGLFYSDEDTDYYLFYRPDIQWLRSVNAVLNESIANKINVKNRRSVVFAAGKFLSQRYLAELNITFCQLPYELFNYRM